MIHEDDVRLFFEYCERALEALTRIARALEGQDEDPQEGKTPVQEAEYDAGTVARPSEMFSNVDLEEVRGPLLFGIPLLDHTKEEIAATALHYEREYRDELNARLDRPLF